MKRSIALCVLLMISVLLVPTKAVSMANHLQAASSAPILGSKIDVFKTLDSSSDPAVAYNWKHHEYFVVWSAAGNDNIYHIYGQRIDARTGELIGATPDPVAGGMRDKVLPDVDYDPVHDRYLVVWTHDVASQNWDIAGRFVPWNGSTPSLQEFKVCSWAETQVAPKVAYGRADEAFMVVFTHSAALTPYFIGGMIVPADGSYFNPANGLTVSTGPEDRSHPEIAWNRASNHFMVVYDIYVSGDWDVYGNEFTGTGVKLAGDILLGLTTDDENYGAVASCAGSDQWLVVWEQMVSGDNDLKGVQFEGDLTHIADHIISAFGGHQERAKVSCNYSENGYMVTWQEDIGTNIGISARPVDLEGNLGGGMQVEPPSSAPGNITPVVAGGHTNFMVAWRDRRSDGNLDIAGRLLTPYQQYLPLSLRMP